MQYRLRTLLIVLGLAPPLMAGAWIWFASDVLLIVAIALLFSVTGIVVEGVAFTAAALRRNTTAFRLATRYRLHTLLIVLALGPPVLAPILMPLLTTLFPPQISDIKITVAPVRAVRQLNPNHPNDPAQFNPTSRYLP